MRSIGKNGQWKGGNDSARCNLASARAAFGRPPATNAMVSSSRYTRMTKIRSQIIKDDTNGSPIPSRIDQNGALERSENDLGNNSVPTCLVLLLFVQLSTPLGRYRVPLGTKVGVNGSPK